MLTSFSMMLFPSLLTHLISLCGFLTHALFFITAQESMVLLKNNGFLPLKLEAYKSVAIVGPCADDPVCNRGILAHIALHAYVHDYTVLTVFR